MATCVTADTSGVLHTDSTPVDSCATYILMDPSTYRQWLPFDPASLDPVFVVNAFAAGFIIAGIPLMMAYAAAIVLRTLKRDPLD